MLFDTTLRTADSKKDKTAQIQWTDITYFCSFERIDKEWQFHFHKHTNK